LDEMRGRVALARARTPGTADVAEVRDATRLLAGVLETVANRAVCPHVERLLLRPDELGELRIGAEQGDDLPHRERIQLLDPSDRDRRRPDPSLVTGQVVVDLSRAENEPPHLAPVGGRVVDDGRERSAG